MLQGLHWLCVCLCLLASTMTCLVWRLHLQGVIAPGRGAGSFQQEACKLVWESSACSSALNNAQGHSLTGMCASGLWGRLPKTLLIRTCWLLAMVLGVGGAWLGGRGHISKGLTWALLSAAEALMLVTLGATAAYPLPHTGSCWRGG